jgi:hypothetical protein
MKRARLYNFSCVNSLLYMSLVLSVNKTTDSFNSDIKCHTMHYHQSAVNWVSFFHKNCFSGRRLSTRVTCYLTSHCTHIVVLTYHWHEEFHLQEQSVESSANISENPSLPPSAIEEYAKQETTMKQEAARNGYACLQRISPHIHV